MTRSSGGTTTHTLDLTGLGFDLFGTGNDGVGPVVSDVELLTTGPLTLGDQVRVHVDATDPAGVDDISVTFKDSIGGYHTLYDDPVDGFVSTTIDTTWADGPVTINSVFVSDTSNNWNEYRPDGTLNPLLRRTTTHTLDLTGLGFDLFGTGNDGVGPVVSDVELLTTGPLNLGDQVRVTSTQPTLPASTTSQSPSKTRSADTTPCTTTPSTDSSVPPSTSLWADGPVTINSVFVSDTSNNWNEYRPNGTLNRSQAEPPPTPWTSPNSTLSSPPRRMLSNEPQHPPR